MNKWHMANTIGVVALGLGMLLHAVPSKEERIFPDPKITPGVVLEGATKEKICEKGYAGKVRNVPQSVKNQVYANYGIKSHKAGDYEVDHLISLELGGSNDIKNLWPQSYRSKDWNAHMKDKLENKLHSMVCGGEITLEEAQKALSDENWVESYEKYISN